MAGTIKGISLTGLTVYAHILDAAGQRWNGATFEPYNAANYATYAVTTTEQGASGAYVGSFPSEPVAGLYSVFFYRQNGGTPAEGDPIVAVASFNWDGTNQVADLNRDSILPAIKAATAPGRTVYALITNRSGLFFNVSAFETYNAANYANYVVALAEQGTTGIYTAAFPVNITSAGTYECLFYAQASGSPAAGDPVIGSSVIVVSATGAMTGLQFYNYLLRTFKRTDKETEIYEALSDTIRELRRRVIFADDEKGMTTTDAITVLGDYQLDLEDSWGLTVGEVVLIDGESSYPLNMISVGEFNRRYPNPNASAARRAKPADACLYGNSILLGPAPDAISYSYKVYFTEEDASAVVSSTTAVPYARLYRETIKKGTLMRLYRDLGLDSEYMKYKQEFEQDILTIQEREERNRRSESAVQYRGI